MVCRAIAVAWMSLPALVDWQTVLTLTGLLILTKAVEHSGFLMWAAHRVVHHIHSERALACLQSHIDVEALARACVRERMRMPEKGSTKGGSR